MNTKNSVNDLGKKLSLTSLLDYAPHILILGGIAAASWLLERLVRPTPIVGKPLSWLVKITSLFGFLVGILLMVTAATAWLAQALDSGTRYLLVITGLSLLLKPIKNIPWAALIGLVVGCLCAAYVVFFFPMPGTIFSVSSKWIYVIAFLIPALLVYLLFKFVEDLLRLIGTILASRPVAILLGLVCIAQGSLLLLDKSLFSLLIS